MTDDEQAEQFRLTCRAEWEQLRQVLEDISDELEEAQ